LHIPEVAALPALELPPPHVWPPRAPSILLRNQAPRAGSTSCHLQPGENVWCYYAWRGTRCCASGPLQAEGALPCVTHTDTASCVRQQHAAVRTAEAACSLHSTHATRGRHSLVSPPIAWTCWERCTCDSSSSPGLPRSQRASCHSPLGCTACPCALAAALKTSSPTKEGTLEQTTTAVRSAARDTLPRLPGGMPGVCADETQRQLRLQSLLTKDYC